MKTLELAKFEIVWQRLWELRWTLERASERHSITGSPQLAKSIFDTASEIEPAIRAMRKFDRDRGMEILNRVLSDTMDASNFAFRMRMDGTYLVNMAHDIRAAISDCECIFNANVLRSTWNRCETMLQPEEGEATPEFIMYSWYYMVTTNPRLTKEGKAKLREKAQTHWY